MVELLEKMRMKKQKQTKRKRLGRSKTSRKRTKVRTDRDQQVEMLDAFNRLKPPTYISNKTSTKAALTSPTPWTVQRTSDVYAGAVAYDLDRKIAKEKAALPFYRTYTPIPWKINNNLILRNWTPKTE